MHWDYAMNNVNKYTTDIHLNGALIRKWKYITGFFRQFIVYLRMEFPIIQNIFGQFNSCKRGKNII